MAKIYKIWVEIEEIDEDEDYYENIDTVSLAEFDSKQKAETFFSNVVLQNIKYD